MLDGGDIWKVKWTSLQICRTNGQVINKCSTVSSAWKKTQRLHPVHSLFARLSLVSKTFRTMNHMKILILRGTFNFQRYLCKNGVWPFISSMYINLNENFPDGVQFHLKESELFVNETSMSLCTKFSQAGHLFSVSDLLNSMFNRGTLDRPFATNTFLLRTILNKLGYWTDNGVSP